MNKLLSADPARIGRPDVPPSSDAVDEERVDGTPEELKSDLTAASIVSKGSHATVVLM